MIYVVNCNWVVSRWQQYSTHLHTNSTRNNTMKQNTQNGTYITIRIHKHNKDCIIYKLKQKHTQYITIYTMIKNGTKRTWYNVINEKAIQAKNFVWSMHLLITVDILLLRPSLNFTTLFDLHFLSFELHEVLRGGADKSLARPGRKQTTATKLGICSTYSPQNEFQYTS